MFDFHQLVLQDGIFRGDVCPCLVQREEKYDGDDENNAEEQKSSGYRPPPGLAIFSVQNVNIDIVVRAFFTLRRS